jgi:hypothetical protein
MQRAQASLELQFDRSNRKGGVPAGLFSFAAGEYDGIEALVS